MSIPASEFRRLRVVSWDIRKIQGQVVHGVDGYPWSKYLKAFVKIWRRMESEDKMEFMNVFGDEQNCEPWTRDQEKMVRLYAKLEATYPFVREATRLGFAVHPEILARYGDRLPLDFMEEEGEETDID
jgi:hypothetical protein